jgi:hypothetical protein
MWDHYFLGYRDRSHVGPPAVTEGIVRGGMFEPLVVVDGKAVGMWKLRRRTGGFNVEVRPLTRLPARTTIEGEVADLSRFLQAEVSLGP